MSKWINRSLSQHAADGTSVSTFPFTQPAAGNLLIAVAYGSVTFTTPSGWSQVRSAVNYGGLYIFTKTADGTETSFSCTNNASNYATVAVVYEFPSGSTLIASASKTNASGTAAFTGAALTGLTGTNLLMSVGGICDSSSSAVSWSGWSNSAIEDTDVCVPRGTNDGYGLGIAYLEDSALTSWTPTATIANPPSSTAEAATLAVNVPSQSSPPNSGSATGSLTWSGSATGHATAMIPNVGYATGALDWTGTANGSIKPSGSASGAFSWAGAATGHETPHGSATGSLAFSGSATGSHVAQGSATGSTAFTGSATGHAPTVGSASGAASGTLEWTGFANGSFKASGQASAALSWSGSATGHTPVVGASSGASSGSLLWTGSAHGSTAHLGTAQGAFTWAGTAAGHAATVAESHGFTVGSLRFTGAAHGLADRKGAANSTLTWTGSAAGSTTHQGSANGSLAWDGRAHGLMGTLEAGLPADKPALTLIHPRAKIALKAINSVLSVTNPRPELEVNA